MATALNKDLEEIKKSFQESMTIQMNEFSSKILTEMDAKLRKFNSDVSTGKGNVGNKSGQNVSHPKNKNGKSYQTKRNQNHKETRSSGKIQNSNSEGLPHNSAFIEENNHPRKVNPYFGKRKNNNPMSMKQERKNIKEYVNTTKSDGLSKNLQCECEIVINCIRKFDDGTYEEKTSYDKNEALRALKKFDTNVSSKEIRNVRRHPGVTNSDYQRVTVLFSNSETPMRLAQKAEDNNDFTILQRSVPKDIRDRNLLTRQKLEDLNANRPRTCPFLWSITTVKGLDILIQEPDPKFVPSLDESKTGEDIFHDTVDSPKMGSQPSHQSNLFGLNSKLGQTGNAQMSNLPDVPIEDYIADLTQKHRGVNDAMLTEILKSQGMKSREEKTGKKGSKNGKGASSRV